MPTPDEWWRKLRGVVDPLGAVSDDGTRNELLRLILGAGADFSSGPVRQVAEGLVKELPKMASKGALDDIFLGKETDMNRAANALLWKTAEAVAAGSAPRNIQAIMNDLKSQDGDAERLLVKLKAYIEEHPFIPKNE